MSLHVVGVRHHSPACARLVAETIRRVRPRWVLIEGPSDMNERLDELLLPHALPIALFTYRQDAAGERALAGSTRSRGIWAPFCAYSPEWVALHAARDVGATARFIDLPAWHDAFEGEENRYSDRHARHSDRLGELAAQLGFEDTDALWDHLFESPERAEALAPRLSAYFEQLRGDEPGGGRDEPREAFMARWIAWALADAGEGDVVVVCGGYHKPALERLASGTAAPAAREPPRADPPPGARVGSYLVPFSFRRLDSFAGYASGMPSPAFYQAVFELGHERAGEAMLFETIRHLRRKQQRVSPADAIAASTLAHGLCKLRGHQALSRIDVLDGLAGALVKDALEVPLPWTRRGTPSPRTDPLLLEVVAAFSGAKVGTLAEGTPQPPLVYDAFAELLRVGLTPTREARKLEVPLTTAAGVDKSAVLHRLRVLGIPGFSRTRAPSLARAKTELSEAWSIARLLETDTELIEAALYGATLAGAASAKIEERMRDAPDVAALADALLDAASCGIHTLTGRTLADIARRVAIEPSLTLLGAALERLLVLRRGDAVLGAHVRLELEDVLLACFDRGLWLLEGVQGASAPLDDGHVRAVRVLRDVSRLAPDGLGVDRARARAVCERRTHDVGAPPAIRGAALGFLWSTRDEDVSADLPDEQRAIATLRAVARPASLGDFLAGLFALARTEVVHARELLATIDASVSGFLREDFLIALPALRQAFAYFPPRERLAIAEGVLALGGLERADPMLLLRATVDEKTVRRAAAVERQAAATAVRFGLTDSLDESGEAR
jgi:hypothetical protein